MGLGLKKKIKKGLKKSFKSVGNAINKVTDKVADAVPKPLRGVAKFGVRMFLFGPALGMAAGALSGYARSGNLSGAFKTVMGDQIKLGASAAILYGGAAAIGQAPTLGLGSTAAAAPGAEAVGGFTGVPSNAAVNGMLSGGVGGGAGNLAPVVAPAVTETAAAAGGGLGNAALILGGSQVLQGVAGGFAAKQAAQDAEKAERNARKQDNRWGVNNYSGETVAGIQAPTFQGPVVPTVAIPEPVAVPNFRRRGIISSYGY